MLSQISEELVAARYQPFWGDNSKTMVNLLTRLTSKLIPKESATAIVERAFMVGLSKMSQRWTHTGRITLQDGTQYKDAIDAAVSIYCRVYSQPNFLEYKGSVKDLQTLPACTVDSMTNLSLDERLEAMYTMFLISGESELHYNLKHLAKGLQKDDLNTLASFQTQYRNGITPSDFIGEVPPSTYFLYWFFRSIWTMWA